MVDIGKGISEIMAKKDSFGNSGGLLTGITKGINEVLDKALGWIPTLGAPDQQFNPLPKGLHEVNELYPNWNYYPGGVGVKGLPPTSKIEYGLGGFVGFMPIPTDIHRASLGIGKGINEGAIDEVGLYREERLGLHGAQEEWGGVIKENTARVNTVLEERSYLDFYFPNALIGRRRVVFFENPKITEQRVPKYASKQVVGRNEPVRLFVGADARKVKLSFTYTLPHVQTFFAMMGAMPNGFASDLDKQPWWSLGGEGDTPKEDNLNAWRAFTAHTISKFFGTDFKVKSSGPTTSMLNSSFTGPRFYLDNRNSRTPVPGINVENQGEDTFIQRLVNAWSLNPDANVPDAVATYYTQFVIDTLRASVVGDDVTGLDGGAAVGPPIVRFRHGTVFNEAPFIITSMNIDYSTQAGYEVRTLLPRQVKFTLDMEEFRQTHGSHHGNIKGNVQNSSSIIELNFQDGSINNDRFAGKRHPS
tara:strand:+ start:16684 stop:18105 length:1422 start_codon:yes stop_codon:yes gene_type:complete